MRAKWRPRPWTSSPDVHSRDRVARRLFGGLTLLSNKLVDKRRRRADHVERVLGLELVLLATIGAIVGEIKVFTLVADVKVGNLTEVVVALQQYRSRSAPRLKRDRWQTTYNDNVSAFLKHSDATNRHFHRSNDIGFDVFACVCIWCMRKKKKKNDFIGGVG
jgi:hypothetical protein